LAAAAIYIVSQLPFSQLKCSSKEVADAAGISEITLKLTYKAIYPYRNEIIKYLTGSDSICSNLTKTNKFLIQNRLL
jgi:transcription initiation factor TFIIIB Brf1 subunit/transcription initiation factor TFIIB